MTHDELTQAITAARMTERCDCGQCDNDGIGYGYERAVNAHLDTLTAILDLHQPEPATLPHGPLTGWDECGHCIERWPCPTVRLVESALRNMGAL